MRSWAARMFRGRRLDRNPLRRRSDRAETVIFICLLVAMAVAVPFTARAASAWTTTRVEQVRATELATRHQVTATTLENALPASDAAYTVFAQTWVSAKWTAPDGQPRTGTVRVPDGTQRGSTAKIWVEPDGAMAAPPLPVADIAGLADRAGLAAVLLLICLFLTAGCAVRQELNRRRMAAWDTEWAATEPRWNHQR